MPVCLYPVLPSVADMSYEEGQRQGSGISLE